MHRPHRTPGSCAPAALVLILAGCAATYTEPRVPEDHPGNPAAQGSPLPERSGTLDLARVEPVTTPAGRVPAAPPAHGYGAPGAPAGGAQAGQPREPVREPPTPAGEAATTYTCPMHPEVVSSEPGRCPKCGMTLVKKTEGGERP